MNDDAFASLTFLVSLETEMSRHVAELLAARERIVDQHDANRGGWVGDFDDIDAALDALSSFTPAAWWAGDVPAHRFIHDGAEPLE